MLNLRRIAGGSLHHLWKAEMNITRMAPLSSSAESNARRQILRDSSAKNSIFEKLRSLMGETLDFIMREEEKKGGLSFTQADLISTAEQLHKEGKHEYALEIFEWMDRKKMSFSPEELSLFVAIIAKTKGLGAAHAYFNKVEPDYRGTDTNAKNFPAYLTLHLLDR